MLLSNSDLAASWLVALVESAEDAIISKTLEGIITSWNKGAERLFGYTEAEAVGQPVLMLIPEDHQGEEPEILGRLRRGQKIEHYETIRRHKDGTLLDISLTVSPIRAPDGTIIGASKIARDISERKQSEIRLQHALREAQEARKEAEHANRLKDEFLNTVSHELRTPLTSMLGWISMLRDGWLDEVLVNKGMESLERNIKAQAQLVEDLLDISRIVSGKMRMDFQPLNLSGVIHTAVDSIMPAAQAKGIRLQVMLDPSTGSVLGDPDRLQQVIWNLLSNAVKFTPQGGKVQIRLEANESQAEVTVSDTGKGISAEFLPYIFDRFAQEDGSEARAYGGLGMGLSIVKYITELHGGEIQVSSEGEGQGASFTLTLPLAEAKARPQSLPPLETEKRKNQLLDFPVELKGLKILVVDDEMDTCEMLQTAFEQSGSKVHVATSGMQALSRLEIWHPDLLICDINMPHMDGYEFISHVRSREAQSETKLPAIALTALARVEDRMKAFAAGYQMHVPKPVQMSELQAVVAGMTTMMSRKNSPNGTTRGTRH